MEMQMKNETETENANGNENEKESEIRNGNVKEHWTVNDNLLENVSEIEMKMNLKTIRGMDRKVKLEPCTLPWEWT